MTESQTHTNHDMNDAWGVYIHIPFCVSRCNYCDFNTYSGIERYIDDYFQALGCESRAFWARYTTGAIFADTVFIGGGTPSYVDPVYIERLLTDIPAIFNNDCIDADETPPSRYGEINPLWECTIEVNPGTLNRDKLEAYARVGVNRLSFGLQSTHDIHLKMLGRIHSYEDFLGNYRSAQNIGFKNINADLLFGLPGQSIKDWERTLETVAGLGIRHLSCYSLSIEEGTPLYRAVESGDLPRPDEDADREMYHFAQAYLRSAGLLQYEISNFAEPGVECRHNLKYWTGARYRGFGAGAHSYDGANRYSNALSAPDYIKRVGKDGAAVVESAAVDDGEREKEFIILRLRLTRGFYEAEFKALFGYGFMEKYKGKIERLENAGLIAVGSDRSVRLTSLGMDLANKVFVEFI